MSTRTKAITRKLMAVGAALAAMLAIGACSEKPEVAVDTESEPLTLALDWYVNPDHAGIFHGIERGFFRDAGIDLETITPTDPAAPIRQVAAGQVDLAISYEPEVLQAREQGLPVVAVAAIVGQPLASLVSLPETKISEPRNLRNKTVATAGIAYQAAFLDSIVEEAGLRPRDVTRVDVGLGLMPALLGGKADALLGAFRNIEGVDLEQRGLEPRIVPVDELGIPTYDELVLVANSDTIADQSALVTRFIAALGDATYDANENRKRATAAVLDAGEGLEPRLTDAQIRATLPLLLPRNEGDPYGHMDPAEWEAFAAFLVEAGLLENQPDISTLMTTEYLQPPPAPEN